MENREWDESLKDMLGDYKPEGLQPDWNEFSNYMLVHEQMGQWEEEAFDENLKESVAEFEVPAEVEGWERIEASLNLADQQFDENVRNRINQFEPQFNPQTWTLFLKRFTGLGYLRTKLIAFKAVEVAAVMLILFTVVKMGQMGKLPFETPLYEKPNTTPVQEKSSVDMADNLLKHAGIENKDLSQKLPSDSGTSNSGAESSASNKENSSSLSQNQLTANLLTNSEEDEVMAQNRNIFSPQRIPSSAILPLLAANKSDGIDPVSVAFVDSDQDNDISSRDNTTRRNRVGAFSSSGPGVFMASILSPVRWNHEKTLPKLRYQKQRDKTYTEFGIISQLDYNLMKMPEDRLYSAGQQIVFPQQGIPSSGFGGGFTFAIGHPRWAVETGMIYNAKNFKPGRELKVGDAYDNGRVEFDAMRLQLVSVPLIFRYKIDHKGPFRVYGLTGMGLHLIAQSDIEVSIKYSFLSLSPGDPGVVNIQRETKRIREHIRDGAPFNTKSFLSLNTGAGIEYAITEHKTLFLQSAIQYQVPNLRFSNNNGKHIRSLSMQLGVRTPFGN